MQLNKYFIGVLLSSSILLGVNDIASANNHVLLENNIEIKNFQDINNNKLGYLYSKNIVKGYSDGSFNPYERLTRNQMAIMVSRTLGANEKGKYKESGLLDLSKENRWSIDFLFDLNIINGNSNKNFLPNDKALFRHVAKVLYKTYYINDKELDFDNNVYEEFINNKLNLNYKSNDEISRIEFVELLHDILNDLDFYGDIAEKLEVEKLKAEKLEKNKLESERLELERIEQERRESERLELEKREAERLENERLEKERLEKERLENERLENERLENERLENERLEKERLERERLEKEKLESERLESERLEAERFEIENYVFNSYFEKVEWIDRNGIISLSIYPVLDSTLIVRDANYNLHKNKSFAILKDLYSTDEKWMANTDSLFEQYKCHVDFAGSSKVPWNIEPERPLATGLAMILAQCNPAISEDN